MDSINSLHENEELTIDLKGLLLKVKKYWYFILIGFLAGVLLGIMYKAFSTPQYKASSLVYLRNGDSSISLQDLQIGSELTKDYEVIFKSRPNLEKVISKLNLDYTYEQLNGMVTINNLTDTRILKVEVVSDDPKISKDIANEVVSYGMDSVREIDSQEPYLVEKAIQNNESISTSLIKLIAIGGLLGVLIALGIIFLRFTLSENIQSIEDVERSLNLPVLAVVMEDKGLNYKKRSNKKIRNR
ncbi:YveK family protein [uncultured Clostridium sp.]|uniref:YveK family protein n=1 Tax=uncultured Clostridium sp. TaxID=59620 RepID=UPI002592F0C8|nr:Wzz/FepE/Etk N-terminal domain-containing protein [uncultured Clostridium sp.]